MSEWWKTFRRQYKEEFSPQKDHPKVVNTSLIAPEVWENIPPEHFRYALKQALLMSLGDWTRLVRWIIPSESADAQMKSATTTTQTYQSTTSSAPDAAEATSKEDDTREPTILLTRDEAKQVVTHVARRLTNLSQDEELRKQLVGLGTQALNTARDCLDQFLIGYQEGKNEEIRAFISEQMEKEEEFVSRIKKVREVVEQELKNTPQSPHQGLQSASTNGPTQTSSQSTAAPTGQDSNANTVSDPVDMFKSLDIVKNAEDLTSELRSIWKDADTKTPPKN